MSEIGINSLLVLSIFSLWILPIVIYFVEHKNILNGFLDLFGNKKKINRAEKFVLIFLFSLAIVYGGTKPNNVEPLHPLENNSSLNDNIQANINISSSIVKPDNLNDAQITEGKDSDILSITSFEINESEKELCFSLSWDEEKISLLDSSWTDLFVSTNLASYSWVLADSFWLPHETNRVDYIVDMEYVFSEYGDEFDIECSHSAFFIFGLDVDSDDDSLTDAFEKLVLRTSPLLRDTDGDGVDDDVELDYGYNPLVSESTLDTDGDGLFDFQEIFDYYTDVDNSDTDSDGLNDFEEVMIYESDPSNENSDDDDLSDYEEVVLVGTNPNKSDTDDDGLDDFWEVWYETDPLSNVGNNGSYGDPDNDKLINIFEYRLGTNPNEKDTDSDGFEDGAETGYPVRETDVVPFDCTNGTIVASYLDDNNYDDEVFNVALPFPIQYLGFISTNAMIDINGLVTLVNSKENNNIGSLYHNEDFCDNVISEEHLSIAAYWDDLLASKEQEFQIIVSDIEVNTKRYCVIEYRNIGFYGNNDDSVATFQIVLPEDINENIFVQYIKLTQEFNGKSATIGLQNGYKTSIPVSYNVEHSVKTGDVIKYCLGSISSPLSTDSDSDGLSDSLEFELKTSSYAYDTDKDGMSDGWEVLNGLNPLISVGEHGANIDIDGDGLINIEEFFYDSNPYVIDTDSDGISDFDEVGGIVYSSKPWFNITNKLDITSLFPDPNDSCVTIELLNSIILQDREINQITIDLNGVIYLRDPENDSNIYSESYYDDLSQYAVNRDCFVIAPFWNDMSLELNNSTNNLEMMGVNSIEESYSSKIFVGDVLDGTNLYYAIQFVNMKSNVQSEENTITNRISFQVLIPYINSNRVFITYGDIYGATDSKYASIGFQDFGSIQKYSYCYEEEGKVNQGLSLEFLLGTRTSPSCFDTDGDSLSDSEELILGLNPIQPDSDGDGMLDGWEFYYGFNPFIHNDEDIDSLNNGSQDLDRDGLTNLEECEWDTNPNNPDTDNDGVIDGDEIKQFSDPSDATDNGVVASRVPVDFIFGDHSGSHSEKYRLELSPIVEEGDNQSYKSWEWVNSDYGECETKRAMLIRGLSYEIRLYHAGTNDDEPDYDYFLDISYPNGVGVITNDPSGLICEDNTSEYFGARGKVATITIIDGTLIADFNRDGIINNIDLCKLYGGTKLRHWINDDDDEGDVFSSSILYSDGDIPYYVFKADYSNSNVDGKRDLIDFVPLWINVNNALNQLNSNFKYEFTLSQNENAVNVLWTGLSKNQIKSFQTNIVDSCGKSLNKKSYEADVDKFSNKEVIIPQLFVDNISENENNGVLMLEGTEPVSSILSFNCYKITRGGIFKRRELVFKINIPISISSVEDMYRWVNIRDSIENAKVDRTTDIDEPSNLPDSEVVGNNGEIKNVVFLHGFNVTEKDGRAWNSEIFKRLWVSGFNARFWGVVWAGDLGSVNALSYHYNVHSAFITARDLSLFIQNNISGESVILAHSLGNMVVASAIQDYGLNPAKFFMLNAAIPSEAFNASYYENSSSSDFVHDLWREYPSESWTSNWHSLFDAGDDRSKLTWKNRFVNVTNNVYNFYSSGDEVFEVHEGDTPDSLDVELIDGKGRYSWHVQEVLKGRKHHGESNPLSVAAGTEWSGWGFREELEKFIPIIGNNGSVTQISIYTNCITAATASTMQPNDFKTNTVFHLYPSTMNTNRIHKTIIDEHLAKGIPALSRSTGQIRLINNHSITSLDLNGKSSPPNGWWRPADDDFSNRWLHSDIKNVAYFFIYDIFEKIVSDGGIK